MSSRLLSILLATALFAAAAVSEAGAEGSARWLSRSTEDGVAMMFAVPNSDDIAISIECDNTRGAIAFTAFDELKGAALGKRISMTLGAGGKTLTVPAAAVMNELFGHMVAEAADVPAGHLLDVLRAKGPLSVNVEGTTVRYTEKGRSAAASAFASGCRAK